MSVVRPSLFFLALLCAGVFLVSCGTNPAREIYFAQAAARERIYDRARVEFTQAAFYKPIEEWNDDLGVKLAPLLLHETSGGEVTPHHFGQLVEANGSLSVDVTKPTLYFARDKIRLKGTERDQVVFVWFHTTSEKIVPQGVRITMDRDQHPAIWEILNDTSGIQQVFVSQSLEAAASAQYGPPLPLRRSALERSIPDAPELTVSRVISDGPLAMGPAIYLSAATHDVATLLCRCMPPQVRDIISSASYEIADLNDPTVEKAVRRALGDHANWLNEGAEEMELRLRLPEKF